jgi:hypothetical protein
MDQISVILITKDNPLLIFSFPRGKIMKTQLVILTLLLAGCSSSGVVPMDRDTYFIKQSAGAFQMGTPLGAKIDVYNEANKFCAEQNKQVETVNLEMKSQFPLVPGYAALQFRCVSNSAPK